VTTAWTVIRERLRQLVHRGLTLSEAAEDGHAEWGRPSAAKVLVSWSVGMCQFKVDCFIKAIV